MEEKNRILLGGYNMTVARNGGFQYSNDMSSGFLSNEQDKASQRIADLTAQETDLVLKTKAAFKSGDLKAFNAATKAYEDANKDKLAAISSLLTATNNQTKLLQSENKAKALEAKQQITDDLRVSTSIGRTVADAILKSGVTDAKQIDAYIEQMASENGISNPEVLKSAYLKEAAASSKDALAAKNTASIIAKRNAPKTTTTKGGGTDGGYNYTGNDVSTYTSFLNTGGTTPDGTAYAARGDDGFVDPGSYIYAYKDWVANGGTPQGFLKKFPVTNVNPKSYSTLPAALQPKSTTKTPA